MSIEQKTLYDEVQALRKNSTDYRGDEMRIPLRCMLVLLLFSWELFGFQSVTAELKTTKIPRYDAAVEKAVRFLRTKPALEERETSLVAYALLKAGVDREDPRLSAGIADAERRGTECRYDGYEGSYLAAVDAMLLVDLDKKRYRPVLQKIANLLMSSQRPDGAWQDPSKGPTGPADNSLTQYCVLGLWAAVRANCNVSPRTFDKVAAYLVSHSNPDGGWTYRITDASGIGRGKASTDTMTVAAVGSIGVARMLLFDNGERELKPKFGLLKKVGETKKNDKFRDYSPTVSAAALDASIAGGRVYLKGETHRVIRSAHRCYFYYTLERVAALVGMQDDWYTRFGDTLLATQNSNGSFDSVLKPKTEGGGEHYGSAVSTSFAILYYMRSTQQIVDYGKGVQVGARDLVAFLHPKSNVQKEIGPLDDLLAAMQGKDFSELDVNTDEVVEKVQFSSREELIGQVDKLKRLLKSPNATNRQIAYWALSRTGDFDLVPLLLDGLSDPVLSVNVEALTGLRYISKQPSGYKLSLKPLSHLPDDANEEKRMSATAVWRAKASRVWRKWYSNVRPYAERDGLDEIGLPVD